MTVDIDTFRAGMRRLTAGVCLITTASTEGRLSGLTATAVCSVAADPPTLLICVNRKSSSHVAIEQAGKFAVNALALEDRALADRFASPIPAEEKFDAGLWTTLATGAPVLESALVAFDCHVSQAVSVGTHAIFFGEIEQIRVRDASSKPLLYAHGGYGGFTEYAVAQNADLLWIPSWEH